MKDILTWFSTSRQLKTWLQSTYERYFDLIFHFKADQNLVADHYERFFDLIFHFIATQNLVAQHYGIDFDMIFQFTAAQNLVAEINYIWNRYWHDFPYNCSSKHEEIIIHNQLINW